MTDYNYQVPYSFQGHLIHTVRENELPEWRDNVSFTATMSIDWLEPGASVKRVMLLRDVETGHAYPMFVDDLVEFLRHSIVDHGKVTGAWRIKRTGRKNILYTVMKVDD